MKKRKKSRSKNSIAKKILVTPQYPRRWYIMGVCGGIISIVTLSIAIWYQVFHQVVPDIVFQPLSTALPSPNAPTNETGYFPNHITAEGILVVDFASGQTLFARNDDRRMAPASITKMMTALVAIESYALDDVVTVKSATTEGRLMGLVPQEAITVENLLYGALVHSGNDAAEALAQHYPGGTNMFIAAMNEKAQSLGMVNSNFTNPMGFDDPETYTTPQDLLILARAVLQHKELAKIVAIPAITVSDVSYSLFHPLRNVNELVGKIPGVAGLKTGFTQAAGESVVTLAQRNNHRILLVVLKSADRFAETTELIDWVFTNYLWESTASAEPST